MDHFVHVALHSDEQVSWHSAKASLTKTNTLQYQFSWKPESKMRAYWLVLIRGKEKKEKGRQGKQQQQQLILHIIPPQNRQFSELFVYKQLQGQENKPTLALWHPGWCLLRTECHFQRLHCITAQGSALDRRVGLGAHREYLDIIWENKFSNRPFKEASRLYQPLEQPLFYPA